MRPCTTSIKAAVSLVFLTAAVIALCTLPGNAANDDGDGTGTGTGAGTASGTANETANDPQTEGNASVCLAPASVPGFNLSDTGGFGVSPGDTALIITDPQNYFLSADGRSWRVVGRRTPETGTVAFLEALFASADGTDMPVFVSPRYYYQHDHGWPGGSPAARADGTDAHGTGGDADWLARYTQRLNDGRTIVLSPHNGHGPDSTALARELREAGISKVILAGLSSAPCTDARMRSLTGAGFEVMAVTMADPGRADFRLVSGTRTPAPALYHP